ncbi:MAG: CbiX/SirB N-terminal domain-containing protein [Candidatus Riflebacteria bacterium]
MKNKTIYLLLFHGSTRTGALKCASAFTETLAKQSGKMVKACFLRGQSPDLESAINQSVTEGYARIRVIQLFLLPGAHVNEDIPDIIEKFRHSDLDIEVLPCLVELEEFAQMLQILMNRHE